MRWRRPWTGVFLSAITSALWSAPGGAQLRPRLERIEAERVRVESELRAQRAARAATRRDDIEFERYVSARAAWEAARRVERADGVSTGWRSSLWERVVEPELQRYARAEAAREVSEAGAVRSIGVSLNSPASWTRLTRDRQRQIEDTFRGGRPTGQWIEGGPHQVLFRFQLQGRPIGDFWTRWDPRPLLGRYERGEVSLREVAEVAREFLAVRLEWSATRGAASYDLKMMEVPAGTRLFVLEGEMAPVERNGRGTLMVRAGGVRQVVVPEASSVPTIRTVERLDVRSR